MSFWVQSLLSYVLIAIIWSSVAIISVLIYLLFEREVYFWDKVLDNCTITSAKYQFIIRFIYRSFKETFDVSKNTISVEIFDSNHSLILLKIPPKLLKESTSTTTAHNLKMCRFLLYRSHPLYNICNVVVNHNGFGTITVTTIEIQDMDSKVANIAYIGQPIDALPPQKALITQKYPSATKELRPVERGLKSSQTLTAIEYLILLFLAINLILLLSIYVIPCLNDVFCADYSQGLLPGLLSGVSAGTICALVFVIQCLLYRNVIKKSSQKSVIFSLIKYTFLLMTILFGVGIGALASMEATEFPDLSSGQSYPHQIFWMISIGVAIAVLLLFWIPILSIIAYFIGFLSSPEEQAVDILLDKSLEKSSRSDSVISDVNSISDIKDSKDTKYYNTVIKNSKKVKSISQYTGVKSKGKDMPIVATDSIETGRTGIRKQSDLKQEVKKSPSKEMKRTLSQESTGSGYFQQLMKSKGKVKSVSQYKGVNK